MSVPTVSMSEPTAQPEPAAEASAKVERAPLRELLPTGGLRVVVAAAAIGLALGSFAKFGVSGKALLGAVFCPTLVVLAAIDFKHKLLPNAIILPASIAVGVIVAATTPGNFLAHLLAGLALGGFFFAFAAFFPGSIGMGDAKLGFLLGLALGSNTLGATVIAFAGLLVGALCVLARRGVSARKDAIPFGPFLALGGVLAYFLS
jgi:leader peptidase (prepilin peptidase) / N-methyltransferase